MSAGLANAYVDSQKLDAILCKPCSYATALVLSQMAISEHLIFLGEHAPQTPLVLHAYAPQRS